jgi:hypothetical protein
LRITLQNRGKQDAVATANIGEAFDAAEIVGGED